MKIKTNLNKIYFIDKLEKIIHKKIKKVKRFSSGIINETYLVTLNDNKKVVFRIYNKENSISHVKNEILTMEKLKNNKIKVPKIYLINNKKYFFIKDKNRKSRIAILMEFIDGRELKPTDYSLIFY
jgi:Ser/Thr protein kinase RdoA (MazF antagonist)